MSDLLSCPVPLPSQETAIKIVNGQSGITPYLIRDVLFRAGLISIGLYTAGIRGDELKKGALFGSVSVETFVLGFCYFTRGKRS